MDDRISGKKGVLVMEYNVFKIINSSMSFKSYNKMLKFLPIGAYLNALSMVLNINFSSIYSTMYLIIVTFMLNSNVAYTKDVLAVRELYEDFIKNYAKLNKMFDLSDPVQIYTMFHYLLWKGYLSKGKSFTFSTERVKEMGNLDGANVVTGTSVCRHIAPMLRDILIQEGISSGALGVYDKPPTIDISFLDEPKYSEEDLLDSINKITNYESLDYALEVFNTNKNIEIKPHRKDILDLISSLVGNHCITFASKNEKNYFLDPSSGYIYRMREDKKLYNEKYDKELPIHLIGALGNNEKKVFIDMIKNIKKCPNISLKEEQQFVKITLDICNNNRDIFEQFYNENCELYDELSSRILKL